MEENYKKSTRAEQEEDILKFWEENKFFEKTIEKNKKGKEFVFYDGPPFATGLPHYGHLLQSAIKDVIPRYKTMKGYRTTRKWGWDVHGLPIENIIEKELNLKSKKNIKEFGIKNFNEVTRKAVLRYANDWKKIIKRFGRWVDMNNPYNTMDPKYTETVWWVFKNLYDKKLIYEDYKSMHMCPRCETTLANFEVNQGYKDIKDISTTVKFENLSEPGTYFLAWTTTPWTLPANVALAVNPNITYVKVHIEDEEYHGIYILAKKRLLELIEQAHISNYEVTEELKGSSLVGKLYMPPFSYYFENKTLPQKENGWKIYSADFVTTDDGTGIVHIAPAFGENDLNMRIKYKLPFIQHVGEDGIINEKVTELSGRLAKPKSNHQETDIEVIKYLANKGLLFEKHSITHPYPHCWRCDTPLLNYATNSWFVRVPAIQKKLINANKKINWVPNHIKNGRFGMWLENAHDWAISRSRFWGAPLPVWKSSDNKKILILGSTEQLKEKTNRNNYFVMRHGEADSNAKAIVSSLPDNPHHLTEKGKKQIVKEIKILKTKKIDFIYSSDFIRTKETALIVAEALSISKESIVYDERIREINAGDFNLKPIEEYRKFFSKQIEKFKKRPQGGETVHDVKIRAGKFLYDIDLRNKDKNILIITHEYVVWMIEAVAEGLTDKDSCDIKNLKHDYIKNAESRNLSFSQLPHNESYELDFHKPYIDDIHIEINGVIFNRIPEVFDCWFESGSMPYGQFHYPFENNRELFNPKKMFGLSSVGFPADFIGEAVDQTRGWFYSLLVLSVALFNKSAYKNVIATGVILSEDGRKMSKSIKNYSDPLHIINTYGSDALRFYLLSSPLVRGEDLNFDEKGVSEVMRKIIERFYNIYNFFELYRGKKNNKKPYKSFNILDIWILSRLDETIISVGKELDAYKIDRATRPLGEFIEDVSVWYVRRSRERLSKYSKNKKDSLYALATLEYVIIKTTKIIAPFMPFISEQVYQNMVHKKDIESVHLCNWPKGKSVDTEVIKNMKKVRNIVEDALALRSKNKLKVRQPLAKATINVCFSENEKQYIEILEEELNIKYISFNKNQKEKIILDTNLTKKLINEGNIREFIRNIQSMRKEADLLPDKKVDLFVKADKDVRQLINFAQGEIKEKTSVSNIVYKEILLGKETIDGDLVYTLKLNI